MKNEADLSKADKKRKTKQLTLSTSIQLAIIDYILHISNYHFLLVHLHNVTIRES